MSRVPFVFAASAARSRSRDHSAYSGFRSIPTYRRPSSTHAWPVVPLPLKGSRTCVPGVAAGGDDRADQGQGELGGEAGDALLGVVDQAGDLPDVVPELAAGGRALVAVLRLAVAGAGDRVAGGT
jgi:hypothetical protein